MHAGFAEKGLPMLWCSSRHTQGVGCLVASVMPFEVVNHVSLQL
jgi:hypothetical protein